MIVDDYQPFRRAAREVLESEGFSVVGEAPDGASAIAVVRELRPEVVLLDIQLPDIDGFEVARRLAAEPSAPATVLTSVRAESDYRDLIATSPARGFVGKSELTPDRVSGLVGGQP